MRIVAFTGAGISKASGIPTFAENPELRDVLERTYAKKNPREYNEALRKMVDMTKDALPNDAHLALQEYGVEIITMNIDGLHEKAGSEPIAVHGKLPAQHELSFANKLVGKPVLYGDRAPEYTRAIELVKTLTPDDYFLVVGTSKYTTIANTLVVYAKDTGAQIIEINKEAEILVRDVLFELTSE